MLSLTTPPRSFLYPRGETLSTTENLSEKTISDTVGEGDLTHGGDEVSRGRDSLRAIPRHGPHAPPCGCSLFPGWVSGVTGGSNFADA